MISFFLIFSSTVLWLVQKNKLDIICRKIFMFCQNNVVKNNYTFVNSFLVVKKNCAVLHINLELKPETASRKKN